MKKNIVVLLILLLTPLLAGFWAGYNFKTRNAASTQKGLIHQASFRPESSVYTEADRDSIAQEISGQRRNAITRAVGMASPAVVGINVTEVREYSYRDPWGQFFGNDPFFQQFFGPKKYKQELKSLGSGFIISPDGYIVTNDHVAGNGTKITVTLTSKEKFEAKLIGTDPASDLCLLKINGKNLPYLSLGNSDDVIIGEWVIALGNPFGLFELSDKPTVTVGVVSATGMNINAEEGRSYRGMIQTDASINSGNSGGPLINALGEVIGVNSVIFTPNQGSVGVGFAIPVNRVKKIVDELKSTGKVDRNAWTGFQVQMIDARIARYFGLGSTDGVIVSDVRKNSPAAKSGLKVGDVILEVNGEPVLNDNTLIGLFNDARVGDVWKLKIIREKQPMDVELTLEQSPQ